jgi:putative peptidoglycan lipid II flippase
MQFCGRFVNSNAGKIPTESLRCGLLGTGQSMQEELPKQQGNEKKSGAEKSLARSSLVVSSLTFLSRIMGLLREIVIAALFGASAEADAFFVAFRIPNFLRRLFAEGAFSQAFVPVLSEYRQKRSLEEVKKLLDHVAGRLSSILLIVSVVGVIGAPVLATVFAPGYLDDSEKFNLLVDMLRITFPYILLISLTGFAGGILNSYNHFAVPAFTPVFLNISLIICAVWLSPLFAEPVIAIAWGVIIAGIIQLMFQLPFLAHLHLIPRPQLRRRHEGVTQIITLMIPIMFSVSVGQINLLLDTVLVTFIAGDGNVSWLYYADRIMYLPLGVFAVAIATVILPSLSRKHAEVSVEHFKATLDWGLRCILLIGIPACIALVVLAQPLVITIYQRGEFTVESVLPTAQALQAYSLGLIAFMAVKVLVSAYFARQDTSMPVRYGIIAMLSNMLMNLLLVVPLAHVGLALATAFSSWINAGLLLFGLMKVRLFSFQRAFWGLCLRLLSANLLMLVFLLYFADDTLAWLVWTNTQRISELAFLCLGGAMVYLFGLLLMGLKPRDFYN